MERGTELSQTVATFIIQKILSDVNGLNYICQTRQRFFTVITVMDTMVKNQKTQPSQRLLKHIARCYQKLFENPKAKDELVEQVPAILNEKCLEDYFDENTKQIVNQMKETLRNWSKEVTQPPIAPGQKFMPQQRMDGMINPPNGVYQMDPNAKGKMTPTMSAMMGGMDNSMNKQNSGRNSTNLKQPVYYRPSSTNNYAYNNQMFRGQTQRTFVPAAQSHPFSRPGSSQAHVAPLYSNMGTYNMPPTSPPPIHQPSQPVMMQYINPIPISQSSITDPNEGGSMPMMRMAYNQSPYYQSPYYPMMSQPASYHAPAMVSGMHPSGMMQSSGMYMAPQMASPQAYMYDNGSGVDSSKAKPRYMSYANPDASSNM
uniref:Uncharacterized protein n=1 Tax=Euplotes harpa TaxID=151035 RepID=A0A7S3J686_9SPIT